MVSVDLIENGGANRSASASWMDDAIDEPKQARSRRSMQKALDAARRLLVEQGAANFTMAQVAQEAGQSVGGVYARFPSKDVMLRAVKDMALSGLEQAIELRLGSVDRDPQVVVTDFVEVLVGEFSSTGSLYPALLGGSSDPAMAERGTLFLDRTYDIFEAAMRTAGRPVGEAVLPVLYQICTGTLLRRAAAQLPLPRPMSIGWKELSNEVIRAACAYYQEAT